MRPGLRDTHLGETRFRKAAACEPRRAVVAAAARPQDPTLLPAQPAVLGGKGWPCRAEGRARKEPRRRPRRPEEEPTREHLPLRAVV